MFNVFISDNILTREFWFTCKWFPYKRTVITIPNTLKKSFIPWLEVGVFSQKGLQIQTSLTCRSS